MNFAHVARYHSLKSRQEVAHCLEKLFDFDKETMKFIATTR